MRRVRKFLLLAAVSLLGASGVLAQEPGQREGVLIVAVEPDGPAATAGLARGDIILSMAGVAVNSVPELLAVLEEHAGTQVEVRFRHGDDLRAVPVSLGDGSDTPRLGIEPESRDLLFSLRERLRSLLPDNFELELAPVAGARLTMVVEAGPAAAAGLQAGDVITHLDGVPVTAGGRVDRPGRRGDAGGTHCVAVPAPSRGAGDDRHGGPPSRWRRSLSGSALRTVVLGRTVATARPGIGSRCGSA